MSEQTASPVRRDPVASLRQGCERPWEVDIDPFKVAPDTYYVGNSWVGCYLLNSSDGLILIDSTMQPQVHIVLENIRKLGFDPKDIKLLLLSHMHYDHVGGARVIAELSGAQIMLSREDHDFLNQRPDMLFDFGYPYGEFKVDAYYDDAKPIHFGNREITTILTPGHTPGTTSFFFDATSEEGKTYRCGLHGGIGLNTLSNAFLKEHSLPKSYQSDYLHSLQALRDLKIDISLGSHPIHVRMLDRVPEITENHNPFYEPELWPRFIDDLIEKAKIEFAKDCE
nr:MBL fold metallo-hydrolase [uncultured Cohaesibacter sp.]